MVYAHGWPEETSGRYRSLPLQPGRPLSDAVLGGTPVWLEDAAQWQARYPEIAPVGTSSGYEASACLPLRVEDRSLGGLVFSFLRPRRFDEIEREYLLAVGALCAQALDRARITTSPSGRPGGPRSGSGTASRSWRGSGCCWTHRCR